MKVTISGWPGAGTTTLTLILANILEFEYVYAGGLFKYFSTEINNADSGNAFMDFENVYGRAWDEIWEVYAKKRIESSGNLILEGKTAGFLYSGPDLFKIILTCSVEERARRWKSEDRKDAEETIRRRDDEVGSRWKELFGMELYNTETFKNIFNLILDTTQLNISEEVAAILKAMGKEVNISEIEKWELLFWRHGKSFLQQELAKKNLLNTPESILNEWNISMKEHVDVLPEAMKNVVLRFA
jgi:CMP/dCMP kinase